MILYTEFLAATLEMRGVIEEKRLAEAFDHIDDDVSRFDFARPLRTLLHLTRKSNHAGLGIYIEGGEMPSVFFVSDATLSVVSQLAIRI